MEACSGDMETCPVPRSVLVSSGAGRRNTRQYMVHHQGTARVTERDLKVHKAITHLADRFCLTRAIAPHEHNTNGADPYGYDTVFFLDVSDRAVQIRVDKSVALKVLQQELGMGVAGGGSTRPDDAPDGGPKRCTHEILQKIKNRMPSPINPNIMIAVIPDEVYRNYNSKDDEDGPSQTVTTEGGTIEHRVRRRSGPASNRSGSGALATTFITGGAAPGNGRSRDAQSTESVMRDYGNRMRSYYSMYDKNLQAFHLSDIGRLLKHLQSERRGDRLMDAFQLHAKQGKIWSEWTPTHLSERFLAEADAADPGTRKRKRDMDGQVAVLLDRQVRGTFANAVRQWASTHLGVAECDHVQLHLVGTRGTSTEQADPGTARSIGVVVYPLD